MRGDYLADQSQNCNSAILRILSGYPQILLLRQTLDLGTKSKLAIECRLDRRNIQFLGLLDCISEPKKNSYPQIDICFLRVLDRAK